MRDNEIRNSGKFGILLRDESRGLDFWANCNVVEHNLIENSGGDVGVAIEVTGRTKDIRLIGNTINESRGAARRIGIRLAAPVGQVVQSGNLITGMSQERVDQRKA